MHSSANRTSCVSLSHVMYLVFSCQLMWLRVLASCLLPCGKWLAFKPSFCGQAWIAFWGSQAAAVLTVSLCISIYILVSVGVHADVGVKWLAESKEPWGWLGWRSPSPLSSVWHVPSCLTWLLFVHQGLYKAETVRWNTLGLMSKAASSMFSSKLTSWHCSQL